MMQPRIVSLSVLVLGVFVLGVMLSTVPAVAHHSFSAEFDSDKPVTLNGIVTKVEWTNPHVWIYLDVTNEDGTAESWGFEMGPPHLLQRRGWGRTTLNIGDEVTVDGSRARNGSNRMNARTVTLASTGERLGAGSSEDLVP